MRAQMGSRTVRIFEPVVRECRECRGVGEVPGREGPGWADEQFWVLCSACNGSGETWR